MYDQSVFYDGSGQTGDGASPTSTDKAWSRMARIVYEFRSYELRCVFVISGCAWIDHQQYLLLSGVVLSAASARRGHFGISAGHEEFPPISYGEFLAPLKRMRDRLIARETKEAREADEGDDDDDDDDEDEDDWKLAPGEKP